MIWNLFLGFLALGLGITGSDNVEGWLALPSNPWEWGSFVASSFYLLSCLVFLPGKSPTLPFLVPLIVIGPLIVFSSWFWWDALGVAGWGAVIAAVPLCIILAFLALAVGEEDGGTRP